MGQNTIEVLITLPFNETQVKRLSEISPRLHITVQATRRMEDISADLWRKVEILYTDRVIPDPEMVPNLRWVQFHFAGIDHAIDSDLLQHADVIATSLSGANIIQSAEYAVMMMLAQGHRMPELAANQARAEWPRDRWERFAPQELAESTVGIVGYGSIGRQVARLLQPFGATVVACKRDVMRPDDKGYVPDGLGDPQGDFFTRLYPFQALHSMLKICDFVLVSVPLTPETQNMIGAPEFEIMKPTAFLVDLSRGKVVNHEALIQALQDHKLAGAALDVFPEEPLPPTSPLWHLPNVIITPHISGISPNYNDRAVDLFAENLNRYLVNVPLYNQFDLQKGY
ncbi:MAG TPA: D-2-hydroxyacid dehydrogenase [Anaerolineaceae bacterium]|nr:D-2-hydroxyacid dehydrogenase [Anaerolineaceae bacterium]HPN51616.1 D-2-hydroxyacid dehydrogenase [Anaerolineaceae bacterium]